MLKLITSVFPGLLPLKLANVLQCSDNHVLDLQVPARQFGSHQAPASPQAQQPFTNQPTGMTDAQPGEDRDTDAADINLLSDSGTEAVPADMRLPPEALFQRAKSALKQRSLPAEENLAQ